MKILVLLSAFGLTAVGLLFWAFVVYRLVSYPENHIGFNILWSLIAFGPLAINAWYAWFKFGSVAGIFLMSFALVSAVVVLCFYQFSILLPYEEWVRRGMPERPF